MTNLPGRGRQRFKTRRFIFSGEIVTGTESLGDRCGPAATKN
jgi:hypothetical protein